MRLDEHIRRCIRSRRVACGALALLAALCAMLAWRYRPTGVEPGLPRTAFYVWQQKWTPAVATAVQRAVPRMDALFALLCVIGKGTDGLGAQTFDIDWPALARAGVPVTVVFRVDEIDLTRAGHARELVAIIASVARKADAASKAAGAQMSGIQLDYDCPTSKLETYGETLAAIRGELGSECGALSITALPAWLRSRSCSRTCRQADFFVLQIHALQRPTTLDAPLVLYETRRFYAYLRGASRIGTPFFVALPTYGYAITFDEQGNFVRLAAEWGNSPPAAGQRTKHVMADPAELATVVRSLRERRPRHCLGIAWFRLPVATDTHNWTWDMLEHVLEGREPPKPTGHASSVGESMQ
ncbi:MAG TPA: DUF3142 domain-containing protein [Candidatus Hydrogenedentes bacterium]|nr:DUF3142 domain-containing protein [Candidatus Hydrogenedentota bacterium]HOS01545.1 DUF3142 domain-containing protein [Candidatus Hydrogenedentota bacterium]